MAEVFIERTIEVRCAIYAAMRAVPCERELMDQVKLTLGKFLIGYGKHLVVGLKIGGHIAGGMMFYGGYVHLAVLPRFKSRWFFWLRPMLEIGFERFGPKLTARVYAKNADALKFVEQVGCVRWRVTDLCVEYDVIRERMIYGIGGQLPVRR